MEVETFKEVSFCPFCRIRLEPETAHRMREDCSGPLAMEVERLWKVLKEVSEGRGRFSMDNDEMARNTIEDMKELAVRGTDTREGRYHGLPQDTLEVGTKVRVFSDGGYKASKRGEVADPLADDHRWQQPVPPTPDHVAVSLRGDDGFWLRAGSENHAQNNRAENMSILHRSFQGGTGGS